MSGFGNSKTINNESSILNSGTNLVVNSIVTTSPTIPFACGAITVTGDVTSSGDVNIGGNTVRAGTVETGFIRCNYMNSPTGETVGPMTLDPNYITDNYVRIQDKLQVNGVSEFLGNMTSTGSFNNGSNTITCGNVTTTGLITNSIVSSGTSGPLTIDPNYSTNNYVQIYDKLQVSGDISATGRINMGDILYINYSGQNANFQMTNYGHCHMNMASSSNYFNMNCNCWAVTFGATSDDRIKTNETLITNATETLLLLRPETYDKYSNFELTGEYKKESGFIAQEVYNIEALQHLVGIPPDASGDLTTSNSTNPQDDPNYNNWGTTTPASLNYNGLIAYLVKSIQELNARINVLENP